MSPWSTIQASELVTLSDDEVTFQLFSHVPDVVKQIECYTKKKQKKNNS